eukprot:CAMPEP_0183472916 /NCGR_PEP_ID=MMETSP0370-20130417/160353_1 /TAXON_ID=268820 /ORGANISM="Peridinium aciculiferum, Strain PAER-2" /LENGTH=129 /DNA_ID=CAMNT_0025665577 /DNA_START=52 /DNA_END=437 /DNA_ORIENTATION=+
MAKSAVGQRSPRVPGHSQRRALHNACFAHCARQHSASSHFHLPAVFISGDMGMGKLELMELANVGTCGNNEGSDLDALSCESTLAGAVALIKSMPLPAEGFCLLLTFLSGPKALDAPPATLGNSRSSLT